MLNRICMAPLKIIQNRTNYVPYITPTIRKAMQDRNKLKEEAAISGRIDDFEAYKKKRNQVTKALKTAEKDYYDAKLNEGDASKTMWRTAFNILGNQRTSFPSQILHCGQLLSSPQLIAAAVNEFFVSKISNLKKESSEIVSEESLAELKTYLSKKKVPHNGFHLINKTFKREESIWS